MARGWHIYPGEYAIQGSCKANLPQRLRLACWTLSFQNVTRINQDTNIFVSEIQAARQLGMGQLPGRQVYLACLEGALSVNDMPLNTGDALKIWFELGLSLTAVEDVHLIMVEMPEM
jgi:redox-sensitive bicupin YhaK (pirin superfamily)